MITFMESKERVKEGEKCLDSQLWHACAGSMVQMPPVNSRVFYFPQGHAEHACGSVDFRSFPQIPAYIRCRVAAIKFMADPDTDEVFAKVRLIPVNDAGFDETGLDRNGGGIGNDAPEKPASFAKTLTQSDANNGGGFSVPRYCAETIFPPLDYSADPPVQNILAKDVHGETWKFRHIYRGTPRRHLLTTGWSTFVNQKKLVAGDSIVFLRAENTDLCVGIRRAKRGIGGGEVTTGWNGNVNGNANCVTPYGGFSSFLREDDNKFRNAHASGNGGNGKVKAESVVEAAILAAKGQPFEVVYYPRASTPEFCVKASLVKQALQIRWCAGIRFKMPFETEDSSRISWFMGTISSVQVADPIRWPDSPWRLLQVTWDEPDLLQNVKRVSPWLVELVSNLPTVHHLSPFSPPRKKPRLPQHPGDFPFDGQIPIPSFSGNHFLGSNTPFGCLYDNTPAGMQGARHAQFGLSLSDLHFNKQMQSGFYPVGGQPLDHHSAALRRHSSYLQQQNQIIPKPSVNENENLSCLLTMGSSSGSPTKSTINGNGNGNGNGKAPQFVLFGQHILTEQQISLSCSDTISPASDKPGNTSDGSGSGSAHNLQEDSETGHCKVFMESDDVGRTLDLSLIGSFEELYGKLAGMFGIGPSEVLNHVVYRDLTGNVKQIGEESYSDFMKTARRLTILTDSSSDNIGA